MLYAGGPVWSMDWAPVQGGCDVLCVKGGGGGVLEERGLCEERGFGAEREGCVEREGYVEGGACVD